MSAVVAERRLNEEQQLVADAQGVVFVSAGAGTGKTAVLVDRFVRATCERGIDVGSILVMTYTRKAAGELRARIRAALLAQGRPDLARELDGAWISTVHGFCSRLLRQHPFEVGLDPRFRELDEATAVVLRGEAFDRALSGFVRDGGDERLRLLATYGSAGLRRMLTRVHETLRSAGRDLVLALGEHPPLDDAITALREAARQLEDDPGATDNQRANAARALELVSLGAAPERLLDLASIACRGARAASYEEARRGVERGSLETLAASDRELLQELLDGYAAELAAAKQREGVVDFEDLQLFVRTLLVEHPDVRAREAARFRLIMVDEFQDTNRLQCEIVDAIADSETEVFFVGDEFQSIYGFRHADVEVFRERRAAAANVHVLRQNYRSRPEVLDAVNHLFSTAFGDEFQPLTASGTFSSPTLGHPVELLVTDKGSYREGSVSWRHAEARQIARRVRELVDTETALPGEIVLLFAAGTDAELYEEELRRVGLPTSRATGKSYFGQQQVADLLAYLALLQNRYDDRALATVLASPLVGVSNDALVTIRRNATRRPLYTAIERGLPDGLTEDDRRLLRAFLQRYERLVGISRRIGLEHLCERILVEHDYDLAMLVRWDGTRRYANVRKLARMAREFEAARGADLGGFVRYVRDLGAFGAKEIEAVSEEEGADAVRLLTIHAAKGLEFKVVIVADAGRDTSGPVHPDEILALSDGRFGFRAVNPARGERQPVFDYESVEEAHGEREGAERLRLYYVAMTRAIDRLIVSGAIDFDRTADRVTPIGWVLDRLDAHDELAAAPATPVELVRGDARFLARVARGGEPETDRVEAIDPAPGAEPEPEEPGAQLALFEELSTGPARQGLRLAVARRAPAARGLRAEAAFVQRHLAARAVLVPLLGRAGRGHAAEAARRRGRNRRSPCDRDR